MPPIRTRDIQDALGEGYATEHGRERGMLRNVLTGSLRAFTGDIHAKMRWTPVAFRDKIFLRYPAKLVGWLPHVDFGNLSKISLPTATVRELLDGFAEGRIKWEIPTLGELIAANEDPRNACPGPRFQESLPRSQRNDVGRRRERPTVDPVKYPKRYERNGAKSKRRVSSDEDGQDEDIEDADEFWGLVTRRAPVACGELAEDPITSF